MNTVHSKNTFSNKSTQIQQNSTNIYTNIARDINNLCLKDTKEKITKRKNNYPPKTKQIRQLTGLAHSEDEKHLSTCETSTKDI